MKQEIKKISKIVDEVVTYFLYNWNSKNINVDIKSHENEFYISIVINNINLTEDEYQEIKSKLSGKRKPELEDYYWQLSGESVLSNELYFVTIMSDKILLGKVENTLLIDIIRKK